MATVGTHPVRAHASIRILPTPAGPDAGRDPAGSSECQLACALCRKTSEQVKFAIIDPANGSNICESCADECVRVFATTCVC